MPEMKTGLTTDDALLEEVAKRTFIIASLAAEKSIGHILEGHPDPIGAPPDDFRLENVFLSYLRTRPASNPRRAHKLREKLQERRRTYNYKSFSSIDVLRNTPIIRQAESVPWRSTYSVDDVRASLLSLVPTHSRYSLRQPAESARRSLVSGASTAGRHRRPDLSHLAIDDDAAVQPAPPDRLDFRINHIWCIEETTDPGQDEIRMGGTKVNNLGNSKKIRSKFMGNFSSGDKKNYAPKVLTKFKLSPTAEFPRSYHVVLVMAEEDLGGLNAFLEELVREVAKVVAKELAKLGLALVGLASALVAAIALVAVIVVDLIVGWIVELCEDEIFEPQTLSLEMSSFTDSWDSATGESPVGLLGLTEHGGSYQIGYSWRIYKAT